MRVQTEHAAQTYVDDFARQLLELFRNFERLWNACTRQWRVDLPEFVLLLDLVAVEVQLLWVGINREMVASCLIDWELLLIVINATFFQNLEKMIAHLDSMRLELFVKLPHLLRIVRPTVAAHSRKAVQIEHQRRCTAHKAIRHTGVDHCRKMPSLIAGQKVRLNLLD